METIAEEGEPAPEKKAVFVSPETEAQKARRVEAEKARFEPAALTAIAATFQEFGSGKLGDPNSLVLLSEEQFTELCTAMGMVNTSWAERLFAAMDEDGTGAMDVFEFLAGLRRMCDAQGRGAKDWPAKRLQFAFNMFDLDKSESLDEAEVEAFIENFSTVAEEVVDAWIREFERIFGPRSGPPRGG